MSTETRGTTNGKMSKEVNPEYRLYSKAPIARFRSPGLVWSTATSTVCFMYTALSKLWITTLNKVPVHNRDQFLSAVYERNKSRGLITISNHRCCIDDPLFLGMLKWRHVFNSQQLRWSMAAHDICFTKHWHNIAMSLGKILPIIRGDGVYQRTMEFVLKELNDGKWVHVFPEGKIHLEKEALRLKWGVGRLIADCNITPIVLPIHHIGFDNILPNKTPYIPQIGQKASIYVGELMDYTDIVQKLKKEKQSAMDMRKAITDSIQEEMATLKLKAEEFHRKQFSSSAS